MRIAVCLCLMSLAVLVSASTHHLLRERMLEQEILSTGTWSVPDYKADSGGCTPLTKWEDQFKTGKWYEWQKRLPKLAKKVEEQTTDQEKAAVVLEAIGENNMWMLFLDGWTHPKGGNSFGDWYIKDMLHAVEEIKTHLGKKRWLDVDVYTKIHELAFTKDASRLDKRNGFRRENSGVYLPLPDKPLGVFHDIHEHGKITFDKKLRIVADSPPQNKNGPVWKYNGGFLYRWRYPGISEEEGRKLVQSYMTEAWNAIESAGSDMDKKLRAVVKLYHSLENFHCFIDGNGRTNYLVLQSMLCEIGLHPVMLYNLMESALSSVEEERERVLEGLYRWEQSYESGQSDWTIPHITERNKECEVAIAQVMGTRHDKGVFVADTMAGCMCKDVSTCDSNKLFKGMKWCKTNDDCAFLWDYCAPGRSSIVPSL